MGEELANVSYAYWIVNSKAPERLPGGARRNSALKEIRRHYVGEGRNRDKALAALKETIAYRRQYRMNVLRSCFYDDDDDIERSSPEDAEIAKRYKRFVLRDRQRQSMVVRGVDSQSR